MDAGTNRWLAGSASRAIAVAGSATVAIALMAAAPAVAAEAAADQAAEAARESGDIVVTAQKREQNVQDVPISIEVMSGAQLKALNITDMKDAVNYLPNVFVQTTAGNDTIYIRGFGSPPANYSFDQSVSLFLDGIYAGRARQSGAQFFDLERIEVMRGPQGALFGKNTPAGAISIVSALPTTTPEFRLTGLYDISNRGPQISGYASGPLTDTLSARIAFRVGHRNGYLSNHATGRKDPSMDEQLLRATLRFVPTDSFDYTARFEFVNREFKGGNTVSSPVGQPQQPRLDRYLADGGLGPELDKNRAFLISGTGNLSVGEFTLQSITGVSWFRADRVNGFDQTTANGGTTPNSVYNRYPERFHQFSQEIRLLSPTGGTLEYVLGGYYDNNAYFMQNNTGFNIAALNYLGLQHSNFNQSSRTFSVYGQGTLNLTPEFRVIGSLRYTNTHKRATFAAALDYGPFPLRPITSAAGWRADNNLDPSVTVQYDVARDVMLYASFGRGSKAGGFVSNTFGVVNTPTKNTFEFNDERSRNFEAGVKSSLFDRMMTLNLSVYNTRFTDLQVSVYKPEVSTYVTGNAATATSRGVEAQIVLRPTDNFDITANAAYQDLKYNSFPGAACLVGMTPGPNGTCDLAGRRPALSSKFMGSLQAHGRIDVGAENAIDITATVAGRSRFYNADNQDPWYGVQPGFAKLDARLQYGARDDRWHVALLGRNLTNKLTTGSAFLLPAPITAVPRAILYVEAPRSVSVEATVRF